MKFPILKRFFEYFFSRIHEVIGNEKFKENKFKTSNSNDELPFWCATAKVKKDNSYGEEKFKRSGTKHFRGGAKVYIADAYWGMCETVTVIGHHRSNSRFVKMDVHVKRLENFHLELVYSPKVAELIKENFEEKYVESDGYTKEYAEKLVETLPMWIEDYHKQK